jgi:hypothetical protein
MFKFTGITVATFALLGSTAVAQWLDYPTPGIPRTSDGKPNLSAPAPRTAEGKPDFSGLWHVTPPAAGEVDKAMHTIKAQAWAEEISKKRKDELGRDNMTVLCLPLGPRPDFVPDRIVQTPGMLVMLFDDLSYRQVFLDGRPLPKDPNPTWMGYSVGRWDGDTLVIESAGYNDRTWLDSDGHPHSEALHVTERWRRPDFGHLEIERTLEDPKALAERWAVPVKLEFYADTEMLEYVCAENERDHNHLVGKASDDTKNEVKVAPEVLQQYAGVYEYKPPERPQDPVLVEVSVENGQLLVGISGGTKVIATAVSESKFFYQGAQFEFARDEHGAVRYLIAHVVEGDIKAIRK